MQLTCWWYSFDLFRFYKLPMTISVESVDVKHVFILHKLEMRTRAKLAISTLISYHEKLRVTPRLFGRLYVCASVLGVLFLYKIHRDFFTRCFAFENIHATDSKMKVGEWGLGVCIKLVQLGLHRLTNVSLSAILDTTKFYLIELCTFTAYVKRRGRWIISMEFCFTSCVVCIFFIICFQKRSFQFSKIAVWYGNSL